MTNSTSSPGSDIQVLVVDDDDIARTSLERLLSGRGRGVASVASGEDAIERVGRGGIEVVVSDIAMPAMSGIELLRAIRRLDPDLPVVLVTGTPALETAIGAVESGAFRYLLKPVDPKLLRTTVDRALQVHRLARLKREALALQGDPRPPSDRVGLEVTFEKALDGLWMAFQPILRTKDGSIYGYEALLRSSEPALPGPGHVIEAAERLRALDRLGRAVRRGAAEPMLASNSDVMLFVNLHPQDLLDDELLDGESPLGRIAGRVVLEVTERSSLDTVPGIQGRVARLREMGFRIAVDDLGAGYAGLASFALLEPEVVKLDMSLVRDVDSNRIKQKVVRSFTVLCREMGLLIVAEGVETRAEREALVDIGCDLVQGYHFAKPGRPFPQATW